MHKMQINFDKNTLMKKNNITDQVNQDFNTKNLDDIVETNFLKILRTKSKYTKKIFMNNTNRKRNERELHKSTHSFVIMPVIPIINEKNINETKPNYILQTEAKALIKKHNMAFIKLTSNLHYKKEASYTKLFTTTSFVKSSINTRKFYKKNKALDIKSIISNLPEVTSKVRTNYKKLLNQYELYKDELYKEKHKQAYKNKIVQIYSKTETIKVKGHLKPIKVEWSLETRNKSFKQIILVSKAYYLDTNHDFIIRKKIINDYDLSDRVAKLNKDVNAMESFKIFVKSNYNDLFNTTYKLLMEDLRKKTIHKKSLNNPFIE